MRKRHRSSHRGKQSSAVLTMANMVRRVKLATTARGGAWKFLGYAIPSFDNLGSQAAADEGEDEEPIEVFQGIHIYARPSESRGEALVLHVGGEAEHPVIAAVRDETARKAYVDEFGDLDPGEVAIFNGSGNARIVVKADGSIEAHGSGETPVELALKSDVERIVDALTDAATAGLDGGATYKANIVLHLAGTTPPNPDGQVPVGTSTFKAK